MLSRRVAIAGLASAIATIARAEDAETMSAMIGGGSSPDPYILTELPGYEQYVFKDYRSRTPVLPRLTSGESTGVILYFGDSVSSNTINSTYTVTQAKNHQLNVYNGGGYVTENPMLGCNLNIAIPGSSCVAAQAADNIIGAGTYTRVISVPFGVGGSLLGDWANTATAGGRFAPVKRRLDAAGLTATQIFCICGANDNPNATSEAAATASLSTMIALIRAAGLTAPLFIAKHSTFGNAVRTQVQAAQAAVIDNPNSIYAGPDIDAIGSGGRYDGTHLNSTGASTLASAIATLVAAHP